MILKRAQKHLGIGGVLLIGEGVRCGCKDSARAEHAFLLGGLAPYSDRANGKALEANI